MRKIEVALGKSIPVKDEIFHQVNLWIAQPDTDGSWKAAFVPSFENTPWYDSLDRSAQQVLGFPGHVLRLVTNATSELCNALFMFGYSGLYC